MKIDHSYCGNTKRRQREGGSDGPCICAEYADPKSSLYIQPSDDPGYDAAISALTGETARREVVLLRRDIFEIELERQKLTAKVEWYEKRTKRLRKILGMYPLWVEFIDDTLKGPP